MAFNSRPTPSTSNSLEKLGEGAADKKDSVTTKTAAKNSQNHLRLDTSQSKARGLGCETFVACVMAHSP
jgi:hypothetical protein